MKKVIFDSVKIQNFLSIGEDPIELDFNKGITLITGENKDKGGKNGIGKSTIADAIYWCLFGNTIRELKKNEIQHNKNKKECKVTLEFSVKTEKSDKKYILYRVLNPGSVNLSCDKQNITLSTIPETDKLIKEIIGANEEVFTNAVIMSTNNTIPFMAQKKTDKRKFIEGILQLNIFSDMLLEARSLYNGIKKENDIDSNNFISENRILLNLKESKDNFEQNKIDRIKTINDKRNQVNNDINLLKNKNIPDVFTIKDENKKLEDKKQKLNDLLIETKSKIDSSKELDISLKLRDAKNDKNKISQKGDTCPTCNRKYCESDLDHVSNEIKKFDEIINKYQPIYDNIVNDNKKNQDLIAKINDNIDLIKDKISKNNENILSCNLHHQKIKSLEDKITEYNESIDEIKSEVFKNDNKISEAENNVKKIEKKLSDIKNEMAVLDSVKFIVSEEGVKTFIVKKIIDVLNNRLNFYLKTFDAPCKCIFDETFEETIYNDTGKECSYFNFSGGERKRIDTAILFTFQDILRFHSGTSFSLNIYDELFDSALDDKGVEKILEILKNKVEKYNESVYIISHKNNTKINVDNTIFLEKKDGVTKIVN